MDSPFSELVCPCLRMLQKECVPPGTAHAVPVSPQPSQYCFCSLRLSLTGFHSLSLLQLKLSSSPIKTDRRSTPCLTTIIKQTYIESSKGKKKKKKKQLHKQCCYVSVRYLLRNEFICIYFSQYRSTVYNKN